MDLKKNMEIHWYVHDPLSVVNHGKTSISVQFSLAVIQSSLSVIDEFLFHLFRLTTKGMEEKISASTL